MIEISGMRSGVLRGTVLVEKVVRPTLRRSQNARFIHSLTIPRCPVYICLEMIFIMLKNAYFIYRNMTCCS